MNAFGISHIYGRVWLLSSTVAHPQLDPEYMQTQQTCLYNYHSLSNVPFIKIHVKTTNHNMFIPFSSIIKPKAIAQIPLLASPSAVTEI